MRIGEVVLSAVIVYLLAVIMVMCWLHACRRWKQRTSAEEAGESSTSDPQQIALKRVQRKGLDKAMINTLPTFIYISNDQLEGLQGSADHELQEGDQQQSWACSTKNYCKDCPVCLCEFQHKEKGRLLPNCRHRFHVDCIDTWLLSNATCPVCRASCTEGTGAADQDAVALQVMIPESQDQMQGPPSGVQYPTNVLFWGSNSLVSSRVGLDATQEAPAASTITEIYTQAQPLHGASSLSSSSSPPTSTHQPAPSTRLNSLRRLLSRERRLNNNNTQHDSKLSGSSPSLHISIGAPQP